MTGVPEEDAWLRHFADHPGPVLTGLNDEQQQEVDAIFGELNEIISRYTAEQNVERRESVEGVAEQGEGNMTAEELRELVEEIEKYAPRDAL